MTTTLEQLNRDCPEHDRASCSDEHPINAGVDLRYGHAWCRRCQGLWQIKAETALEFQKLHARAAKRTFYCNGCFASHHESHLIALPGHIFLCSDCVDIAHETLHKKIKGEVRADGERINARNDEC